MKCDILDARVYKIQYFVCNINAFSMRITRIKDEILDD